jgi:putative SOS response-associated peptidase YedK
MCGRFTLTTPDQDLAVQFNLPEIPSMRPRYNIAPTQPVAAVRMARETGNREMVLLRWGLIPFWHWKGPDESVIQSCTLLTTEPNELLRPVHNRMPVILDARDYDLWLDLEVQDVEKVQPLLRPFSSDAMNAYPVSRWVNRPQNDDPRCIVPEGQGEDLQLPGF